MELVEVYRYPQFVHPTVFTARFRHVTNAGQIRARIIKAATLEGDEGDKERDKVNFAFINATLITSPLHLQTAVVQALFAESEKTLRTKTVHSEILWYLNPTHNISEAIKRYGISESTTDLVVMHVASWEREDVLDRMRAVVEGELALVGNVGECTDWGTIIKHYKLDQEGITAEEKARIDNIVVSSVAMKSIL